MGAFEHSVEAFIKSTSSELSATRGAQIAIASGIHSSRVLTLIWGHVSCCVSWKPDLLGYLHLCFFSFASGFFSFLLICLPDVWWMPRPDQSAIPSFCRCFSFVEGLLTALKKNEQYGCAACPGQMILLRSLSFSLHLVSDMFSLLHSLAGWFFHVFWFT